jgi:hypothetical protein
VTETDAHHVMRRKALPSCGCTVLTPRGGHRLWHARGRVRPGVRAAVAGGPEVTVSWWCDALFGRAVALVLAPRVLLIVRPRGGRLVEAR